MTRRFPAGDVYLRCTVPPGGPRKKPGRGRKGESPSFHFLSQNTQWETAPKQKGPRTSAAASWSANDRPGVSGGRAGSPALPTMGGGARLHQATRSGTWNVRL